MLGLTVVLILDMSQQRIADGQKSIVWWRSDLLPAVVATALVTLEGFLLGMRPEMPFKMLRL